MSGEVEDEGSGWGSLLNELLHLIVSKLGGNNFQDVTNFCAVCKNWRQSYYPRFVGFDLPFLVQRIHPSMKKPRVFHPLVNKPLNMDVVGLLTKGRIHCSKDGWQLMSEGFQIGLVDPLLSNSTIKLPNIPNRYFASKDTSSIGFTFTCSPTLKDCVVFGISSVCVEADKNMDISIISVSPGEKEWKETTIPNLGYPQPAFTRHHVSPVYLNKKLYCSDTRGLLGVFDSDDSTWKIFASGEDYVFFGEETHLVDFNGKLLVVYIQRMGSTVELREWDESTLNWKKVNDLGEYALFLSETSSFAKRTTRSSMKNNVYLPRLKGDCMVFYSVEHGVWKTSENDSPPITDCVGIADVRDCCWMEVVKVDEGPWFVTPWDDDGDQDDDQDTVSLPQKGLHREIYDSYKCLEEETRYVNSTLRT